MPRALLLSPDDQAVSAITGVLEEMSVSCERPLDGLSAAQKLNSNSFDLVLVDCENLPAAKLIFDVCRRGKNGHYPVPIAIVDGRAGLPTAFRLGAELILTKPVAKDQARSTIRTAVSRVRREVPAAENVPAQAVSAVVPSAPIREERAPVAAAAAVSSQPPGVARPLPSFVSTVVPAAAARATIAAPSIAPTPSPSRVTTPAKMHSAVDEIEASPAVEKSNPPPAPVFASPLPDFPEPALKPASAPPFGQSAAPTAPLPSKPANPAMPSDDPVLAELEEMELKESQLKSSDVDTTSPDRPEGETDAPVFSAYQQGQRKRRSPLGALVMLALAAGGLYAAWMYEPGFRAISQPQIDRVLALAGLATQPQSMRVAPAPTPAKPSAQVAPSPIQAPAPEPPGGLNKAPSAVPNSAAVPASKPAEPAPSDATSSGPPLPGEDSAIILSSHGAQRRLAHSVPPVYPVEAHLGEAEGTVVLKAVVDENGKVEGLRLIEGNAALASAAMQAVKQWRYRPYVRDGKVLPFQTVVIVDFQRP
ncbi:MAG: TonB family protein [Terriglobales bacterium]